MANNLDTLISNLQTLYTETSAKLIPENIKYGVTILGVTGSLRTGEEVSYTPLEYIESTGTQYIDTGYVSNNDITTEITFSNYTSTNNVPILSSATAWSNGQFILGDLSNKFTYFYKTNLNIATLDTNLHTYQLYRRSVVADGVVVSSDTTNDGIVFATLKVFGDATFARYAKFRLHSLKLFENSVIIRNFIPVRENVTNLLGLYDKVTGKIFYNNGTGNFIAGPEIETSL